MLDCPVRAANLRMWKITKETISATPNALNLEEPS